MADSTHVSNLAKCRSYLQVLLTYLFSHVGLFGLIIGYAFLGAQIFESFEAPAELRQRYDFQFKRNLFFFDLENITIHTSVINEEYYATLNARIKLYEIELFYAAKNGVLDLNGIMEDVYVSGLQWTFSGALLYCLTIIFTIGFGGVTPRTDIGKVLTVFYASLGIPLSLLFFSNMGDILARSFKFIYSRFVCLCCNCRIINVIPSSENVAGDIPKNFIDKLPVTETLQICKNDEKSSTKAIFSMLSTQTDNSALMTNPETTLDFNERLRKDSTSNEDQRIPVTVVLILLTGYICGGAVVFSLWEMYSFSHGIFFCFMTLSTIGYGDKYLEITFSKSDTSDAQSEMNKKLFCCIYLIIGLSIVAMCFKLLQEEIAIKFRNLARTLGLMNSEKNDLDN